MAVIDRVLEWCASRLPWQQDAVRRLLQSAPLGPEDFEELVALCKADIGLPTPEHPELVAVPFARTAEPDAEEAGLPVALVAVSDPVGVNALAPRRPLTLSPTGLNIVYGDNGSGKSGYVRLLKHACGTRAPGELLGNVFEAAAPSPSATFVVRVGERNLPDIEWTPDVVDEHLRAIEVFDTKRGAVFVNEENEVAYEPGGVRLLSDLVAVCDEVALRLRSARGALALDFPTMPPALRASDEGRWYLGLYITPSDAAVEAHTTFSEEDGTRLADLSARGTPDAQRKHELALRRRLAACEALTTVLVTLQESLSHETGQALLSARQAERVAAEALSLAATHELAGLLPGTGSSDAWRVLWSAARRFSTDAAYQDREFPVTEADSVCVLCQQDLVESAATRLRRFDAFMSGALARSAEEAATGVAGCIAALRECPTEASLTSDLAAIEIDLGPEHDAVLGFREVAQRRREAILQAKGEADLAALPAWPDAALDPLRAHAATTRAAAEEAASLATEAGDAAASKELANLQSRRWMASNADSIRGVVARKRTATLYDRAIERAATGRITAKKTELVDEVVTEPLLTRFRAELVRLGANDIPVEVVRTRGEKARTLYQLRLRGCPSEPPALMRVLSEGEFRVIALAAFLAYEVHTQNGHAVVFDDPVTSLDHDYQKAVATRLADLASDRQVVVFTHSVTLCGLLDEAAEGAPLVQVQRRGAACGDPRDPRLHAMGVPGALQSLSESVAAAITVGTAGDAWESEGFTICCDFRTTLERVVEEVLLRGIVRRFSRGVSWHGPLKELRVLTAGDCDLLDRHLAGYSEFVHSQPADVLPKPPPCKTLKADIDEVRTWVTGYTKQAKARRQTG